MANLYRSFENALSAIGRSSFMSKKNFQYACGPVSGVLCSFIFFFSLVAAHQLPPIKPYYTPEQTVEFWKKHETGTKWGSALMLVSGLFYLPFTAAISEQMRRVPNISYLVPALQLASGAAGIFTFLLPAMVLGLVTYRLERDPQITQTLTDLFFFTLLMPWPSFIAQNFAFAYVILKDQRPRPIWPKFMAVVNIISPVMFIPTTAMHTAKTGPLAWNGVLAFWDIGFIFCAQLLIDSLCLFLAIRAEAREDESINTESSRQSEDKTMESRSS